MLYNNLVESCFFEPRHQGLLNCSQSLTVYYRVGEVGRGDFFDLYLRCNPQGLILKARFKAFGNPYLIAGAEWLCRQLQGTRIDEHPQIDYLLMVQKFAIPKVRYPVALLLEDGYKEIVRQMKKNLKEVLYD